VQISFSTIVRVSCHIPCSTVCISIVPHFSICSPYSRSYSVHYLFSTFFRVFRHVQDHTVFFLIFHVFQFSPHLPGPSVHFSFSRFFRISRHILGRTMCISHFPCFSVFLAMFHVIQCLCLIFKVFQYLAIFEVLKCPFLMFHIFLYFSPYSRSSSVRFLFLTFFSFTDHVPDHTVFVSHFPCFSVLSPYSRY
jgi:hypothetical protein